MVLLYTVINMLKELLEYKMRKIISSVICMLICLFCFTGCGTGGELDMNSAAQQLMSAGIFDETLTEVNQSVTEKRLELNTGDIESCIAYAGTKAVVDEFVLIKATSGDGAENIKNSFNNHIEKQKKSYESYRPDEVPKLESAVVMTSGNYAVLIVSGDSAKAQKIIKDCMK